MGGYFTFQNLHLPKQAMTLAELRRLIVFLFHCRNVGVSDLRSCPVAHRLLTSDSCPLTVVIPANVIVKLTEEA